MQPTYYLTSIAFETDKGFMAYCPELGIAGRGSTVEEACKQLSDSTSNFILTSNSHQIRRRIEFCNNKAKARGTRN